MPVTDVLPGLSRRSRRSIPEQTQRVYDLLAGVYPLSSMLFHSRAHKKLLSLAGITNGMKVLEVATGSGEMFDRITRANPKGITCGIDLSPNMAARTQRLARKKQPGVQAHCQVVDARTMPFRDGTFDAVVSCYLLELLSDEDIVRTMREMHRVLRPKGRVALVLIGQNVPAFNAWYKFISSLAPAFMGPQMEKSLHEFMDVCEFSLEHDLQVLQGGYPSRVVVARK